MSTFCIIFPSHHSPDGTQEYLDINRALTTYPHTALLTQQEGDMTFSQILLEPDSDALMLQKHTLEGRTFIVVGNLRLDNRSDLLRQLSLQPKDNSTVVLHAYLKWGDGFGSKLLGDFSFVIYDCDTGSCIAVRDAMGVMPLYYHHSEGLYIISDAIDVIAAHPGVSTRKRMESLEEYFIANHFHNQHHTFYKSIQKCPRATQLTCNEVGVTHKLYWDVNEITPLYLESEEAYAKHFHMLLTQAIEDRLNCDGPVAAHFSGGLDSTPIGIYAGRCFKAQGGGDFYTFNWCTPEPSDVELSCYEWDDARTVAKAEGFVHREIAIEEAELLDQLHTHNIANEGSSMFLYEKPLLREAKQLGIRTIFSGFGGDEISTARGKDAHYHMLQKGQWLSVWNRLNHDLAPSRLKPLRIPYIFAKTLLKSMVTSRSHMADYYTLHAKHRRNMLGMLQSPPDEAKVQQYYPLARAQADAELLRERQYNQIHSGYHQERLESWTALGKRAGVRYVYPLLDRRIVEFALSIPSTLYYKAGVNRHFYRKAITPFTPAFLLNKQKPPETYRVDVLLNKRLQALKIFDFEMFLHKHPNTIFDHKALLRRYQEIGTIESIEISQEIITLLNTLGNAIHLLRILEDKND